ncbi:MAG: methionine--tRNA ligase subunit beta [Candidatus Aenigmarchaeota archaeon]|nr:methionine--tRNA ligase subunit beta [Candidatus Aenigmarchaeota archaeon]
MISYADFEKLDLRVGTITAAEKIQGADKLLRLQVDLGSEARQLVAGIAQQYAPERLPGRQVIVLANLEPRMLRGVESQGMALAADGGAGPVLLQPAVEVPAGTKVK